MKWVARFKDKVTLPFASPVPTRHELNEDGTLDARLETEQDFARYWDCFRSSSNEKDKEEALAMAVAIFCNLSKRYGNSPHLASMLADARLFSFVVARALFTDIDNLRRGAVSYMLQLEDILSYFSEGQYGKLSNGMNFLSALGALVSLPLDVQPLLDAGLLSCLVSILYRLLGPPSTPTKLNLRKNGVQAGRVDPVVDARDPEQMNAASSDIDNSSQLKDILVVEAGVVHVMKALAQHPGAAQHLADDDSLQILFQIIKMGSNSTGAHKMDSSSSPPLHKAQLYRHSLQILGLLLDSDNGSTAHYIHNHQLIEIILKTVKDFDAETGDPMYTLGVVTLVLDCLQLSSHREADGVHLRNDLRKAQGYQSFVQLGLKLTGSSPYGGSSATSPLKVSEGKPIVRHVDSYTPLLMTSSSGVGKADIASVDLPLPVMSLLDFLVELSQVGEYEALPVGRVGKGGGMMKPAPQVRCLPIFDGSGAGRVEPRRREVDGRIRDSDALQVLQELFLQSDNVSLQVEVLDRLFRLYSSHPDNYSVVQELRIIPLFVQRMATFPAMLQERLLKVLEYAVTVVNCIPEQELLSLCYLLQQPLDSMMRAKVLSFFVKLISFDRQYKRVFQEVGLLELLIDDLKSAKLPAEGMQDQALRDLPAGKAAIPVGGQNASKQNGVSRVDENTSSSALWVGGQGSRSKRIFGDATTVPGGWQCLHSLLERCEGNQTIFRDADGFGLVLPLVVSNEHRPGILRVVSCLICEDLSQANSDELVALLRILKTGNVSSRSGEQRGVGNEAKTDILWAVWRILSANVMTKVVFGEAKGFTLLITVFRSLQAVNNIVRTEQKVDEAYPNDEKPSHKDWDVVDVLLRTVIAGSLDNPLNRIRLHESITSQTFKDLLISSGIVCPEYEERLVMSLFDMALEKVDKVSRTSEGSTGLPVLLAQEHDELIEESDGMDAIYNPGALEVLIYALLHLSTRLQRRVLLRLETLARAGARNQDALTSVGCVGLLLEALQIMLGSSSSLIINVLQIVEVLGVYRLTSSEFRTLGSYLWQSRHSSSGPLRKKILDMVERMSCSEVSSESVSLSPFVEFNRYRLGHACMRISLGERSWPPGVGYSYACWMRYRSLVKSGSSEESTVTSRAMHFNRKVSGLDRPMLRLLTVGTAEDKSTTCAELSMNEAGILSLATSSTSSLSFNAVKLEEGVWYHLVIVHNKPNALAGLFHSSVASLYVNGKLCQTGKLGYTASPVGKALQITIGTSASVAEVFPVSWRLGPCYLFEEILQAPAIFFLYCLGRGYRGIFQDTDLLRLVPHEGCGGGNLAILEALETELVSSTNAQKSDGGKIAGKQGGSGIVWDLDRLAGSWMQLSSKKLIFAFDGTHPPVAVTSSVASIYNLVDPMSAAASPIGGLPRFARLHGDLYICTPCSIGNVVQSVGGVAVVLALIEASETQEMLRCALSLLVNVLYGNPRNLYDMLSCRGYHLLALFLHRRMDLFKMHDLRLLFKIAACEASPFNPGKEPEPVGNTGRLSGAPSGQEHPDLDSVGVSSKLGDDDQESSFGSHFDQSDFLGHDDVLGTVSESGTSESSTNKLPGSSTVLSNPDMMEHVLLDWTLWVKASIRIQISLLAFIEGLVAMHRYRVHNLTVLRRINIVQHLLVTLQRGDVERPVLEKLVVLLGILLEDGFLPAELKYVADFVVMTFDPPDPVAGAISVTREHMSIQVIVRNMLLAMLIDLQVTIQGEDDLESWHRIVSSKLITFLLDEAVHPTTMRCVMTLLGLCLSSWPNFATKFRVSGGYRALVHVLPSFYDSPELYYVQFCLLFGKPVYPRIHEVRLLDFHALMPHDSSAGELFFTELLESIITMAKAVFDRMTMLAQKAEETGDFVHFHAVLASSFSDATGEAGESLQGEALLHKTYAARLMRGDAAAPGLVTSLLRFMVDLAKMCHPFSVACRRADFLESCVDLYFSCARAGAAIQVAALASGHVQQPLEGVLQEMQDPDGKKERTSKFEASSAIEDENPLKVERVWSEDTSIDALTNVTEHAEDVKFVESISSPNEEIPKGIKVTQLQIPKSPSGETDGLSLPFPWARTESPTPSDVSGLTAEMSVQKTPELGSSPLGLANPWLGGLTSSELGNKFRKLSSMTTPTTGSNDFDGQDAGTAGINLGSEMSLYPVKASLLIQLEAAGTAGGPCASGASAVLDLLAEIFAEVLTEQPKGAVMMETALEAAPLYVDSEVVLVFQGLCLRRVMNFLERRLVRDDEEAEQKLDKSRWGLNLEVLSALLVDRVYAGAFIDPDGTLKVLEFLLAMLHLANKDGGVEDSISTGKSLLSLTRGGLRQTETFVQALLKNTNRMFMYSFLPSSLTSISDSIRQSQEVASGSYGDLGLGMKVLDSHTSLKLILAHKTLILCRSNVDSDFIACLCVHMAPMLWDPRQAVRGLAIELWKALLVYREPALEEALSCKLSNGSVLDVLHGGFNRLSTSVRDFLIWLEEAQDLIKTTLDHKASPIWMEYVAAAARFPGSKVRAVESRRRKEMGRRIRETSKSNSRHWEQMLERRVALDVVREAMAAELRVMRQDKYGWVLHAESEWSSHFEALVHERGIWPASRKTVDGEPLWQLCSTEGPYRMRKKLERRKFDLDFLSGGPIHGQSTAETNLEDATGQPLFPGDPGLGVSVIQRFHGLPVDRAQVDGDNVEGSECVDEETRGAEDGEGPTNDKWVDSPAVSGLGLVPPSFISSTENRSAVSIDGSCPSEGQEAESTRPSSAPEDTMRMEEKKLDNVINDDGEYLIRPHLQPGEKIRFRYNCERVVGLDKHDGIFLIGESCLYVIEHYFIDEDGRINEKTWEGDLSVLDRALGVKSNTAGGASMQQPDEIELQRLNAVAADQWLGGRAWAHSGGAWGKETMKTSRHLTHTWRMWKLESVHELLRRRYQLRPVAIEIFSMDGCNELLVFHKGERDEVFKNMVAMNLPRNSLLDTTISGVSKQESNEGGGRLFKRMARSFSKRWQNGEISNFQYLMHLNTLAGRGYNDLTQYPVFPWILADYHSEELDLSNPTTFRPLDKPMGALSKFREEEFRKRYESWEDPEIPRFHYGSHYSSAGSVLFYLIRLPPFSKENRHLQGGQFDHADRLFNSLKDTWLSASQGNTADVKELIPEFFYMPEFLENRFNFDFGAKQSGERVHDVLLPPWAKGSAREFVCKHREALESQYVSENLHHWIDLIFGFRQRGKAAVDATNVFFYLTYEGAVDIDSISDPAMKASILAQINHFGQTPKQLFLKPHPKRKWHPQTVLRQTLRHYHLLRPQELRTLESPVSQIVMFHDRIYVAGSNQVLKPPAYSKYLSWGYQDRSLRFLSYDQDKLLSTHEGLHDWGPVRCAGMSRDGRVLVTGGENGVVAVWRQRKDGIRGSRRLHLLKTLCGHTKEVTCLSVCQPYSLVVSGSLDRTVIFWDLSSLEFVRQLPELPAPASAVYANDMTGEVVTAAGTALAVWSINGDCLAAVNTSQIASDSILSIASPYLSDWMEVSWYVTGHQNGSIKLWCMKTTSHWTDGESVVHVLSPHKRVRADWSLSLPLPTTRGGHLRKTCTGGMTPEYHLVLYKFLSWHNEPVTAICLSNDLKQLYSGDGAGHVIAWSLPEDGLRLSGSSEIPLAACSSCMKIIEADDNRGYCRNCGQLSCPKCLGNQMILEDLGYFHPAPVCRDCFNSRKPLGSLAAPRSTCKVSIPKSVTPALSGCH